MKAVCIFQVSAIPTQSPLLVLLFGHPTQVKEYMEGAALLTISTAQCSHYLCPGTLSCVHFPHHCPCAWENTEDKAELGDGIAICGSKGGWVEGEFGRKVELARKGLL